MSTLQNTGGRDAPFALAISRRTGVPVRRTPNSSGRMPIAATHWAEERPATPSQHQADGHTSCSLLEERGERGVR